MIFNNQTSNLISELKPSSNGLYLATDLGGTGFTRVLVSLPKFVQNASGYCYVTPIAAFTDPQESKAYSETVNSFTLDFRNYASIKAFLTANETLNSTRFSYMTDSSLKNGIEFISTETSSTYDLILKTYVGGVNTATYTYLSVPKTEGVSSYVVLDLQNKIPANMTVSYHDEYTVFSLTGGVMESNEPRLLSPFNFPDVISSTTPVYYRTLPKVADKTISVNGSYDPANENLDYYGKLTVAVPDSGVTAEKTITQNGVYVPSSDSADYYTKVTVNVVPTSEEKSITSNGVYLPSTDGKDYFSKVTVNVVPTSEEKSISSNGTYLPSTDGKDYFSKVTVNVVPTSEEKSITSNGVYLPSTDGKEYFSKVTVSVTPPLQSKVITPDDTTQVVTADSGYYGLSQVTVPAVASASAKLKTPTFTIKSGYAEMSDINGDFVSYHLVDVNGTTGSYFGKYIRLPVTSPDANGKYFVRFKAISADNEVLDSDYSTPVEFTPFTSSNLLDYSKSVNSARLNGKGSNSDSAIVLPLLYEASGEQLPVETISESAFSGVTTITSINAQEVKRVEACAFKNCSNLTSVTLTSLKELVGDEIFAGSGVTSVNFPDILLKRGSKTFKGCTALSSVTIGGNLATLGSEDFAGCSSLVELTLPSSLTNLTAVNIFNNSGLTRIILNSVPTVDSNSFSGSPLGLGAGYIFMRYEDKATVEATNAYQAYITRIGYHKYVTSGTTLYGKVTIDGVQYSARYYPTAASFGNTDLALNAENGNYLAQTSGEVFVALEVAISGYSISFECDSTIASLAVSLNGGGETTYTATSRTLTFNDVSTISVRFIPKSGYDACMVVNDQEFRTDTYASNEVVTYNHVEYDMFMNVFGINASN